MDTVRLSTQAKPTDEQVKQYWQKRESSQIGHVKHVTCFCNPEDSPVRFTYRDQGVQGPDQFLLEMSLPKVCFGNNWTMITDISAAIQQADAVLQSLSHMLPPLPSVGEMSLSRLDVCYNYKVGELLPYYVQALARLDYPHRKTVRFNAETVEYRCHAVKSKVYDKYAETKGESPWGLLRHEITLHRAASIKAMLGFDRPVSLTDLSNDLLKYALERDLHRLGIFEKSFATFNEVPRLLRRHFGPNRGAMRYMALSLYQTLERSQVCEQMGIARNTLNRLLKEIRDIGITLALTEHDQPLPPLEVLL